MHNGRQQCHIVLQYIRYSHWVEHNSIVKQLGASATLIILHHPALCAKLFSGPTLLTVLKNTKNSLNIQPSYLDNKKLKLDVGNKKGFMQVHTAKP